MINVPLVGMINVLLLLLLPLETLSGKDDVVIVEPAAMIVKPSADGKWQVFGIGIELKMEPGRLLKLKWN